MSAHAIYKMLNKRARQASIPPLTPHDMRRTFVVICTNYSHHNVVNRQLTRSGGFVAPTASELRESRTTASTYLRWGTGSTGYTLNRAGVIRCDVYDSYADIVR
jgi:hypothetical protein